MAATLRVRQDRALPCSRLVDTMQEIPVVRVPTLEGEVPDDTGVLVSRWAQVEVPRGRRPSPTTIAVVATLAGIGALALGTAAAFTARDSGKTTVVTTTTTTTPAVTAGAERQLIALLAKPSTRRIVFTRSAGRLVLAVGSGGRAAILVRGLERAAPGKPYVAWAIAPGARPVRAAHFVGTERAVFLSSRLRPRSIVVVSAERPHGGDSARRIVAKLS
jgi:hypothetical protein